MEGARRRKADGSARNPDRARKRRKDHHVPTVFDGLPVELWRTIFGTLPCDERIRCCRLVSRSWSALNVIGKRGARGARTKGLVFREHCTSATTDLRGACSAAARDGHLACLRHARAQGCRWSSRTCLSAAAAGNTDCLEFLHRNGCRWTESVCNYAAMHGHLDTLRYALDHGCPFSGQVVHHAVRGGHMECLRYLRERIPTTGWDEWACAEAASWGRREVLEWLRTEGCPWDASTCAFAAQRGNLDLLRWLTSEGCHWNERTCWEAAMHGHADVVRWARDNGCPWDEATCRAACNQEDRDLFCWALANGCPCTPETLFAASRRWPERVRAALLLATE